MTTKEAMKAVVSRPGDDVTLVLTDSPSRAEWTTTVSFPVDVHVSVFSNDPDDWVVVTTVGFHRDLTRYKNEFAAKRYLLEFLHDFLE